MFDSAKVCWAIAIVYFLMLVLYCAVWSDHTLFVKEKVWILHETGYSIPKAKCIVSDGRDEKSCYQDSLDEGN